MMLKIIRSVFEFASLSMLITTTVCDYASACQRPPFPPSRVSTETYFIGLLLAQMIDAGPNTAPCYGSPRSGPECPARVSGQVVRIERVGGAHAVELQRTLESTRGVAILVPWDDDPSCQPQAWTRAGYPWAVGRRGFFVARLRPEAEWADGKPTFDVQPAFGQPYPHATPFHYGLTGSKVASKVWLSVDEYWTLSEALPDRDTLGKDACAALRPLQAWVAAHRRLAKRYPAPDIVKFAQRAARCTHPPR